jgi:uncharacterized repeat protein (TIGR03803 family)
MRRKKKSIHTAVMLVLFASSFFATGVRAAAQHESVIFSFAGSQKTANGPLAGVIFDGSGNLYGTTNGGGNGFGTVFELIPAAGGGWTEKILYSFNNDGIDGHGPSAGVIFDAAGNLYGTTQFGGSGCNPPSGYCGTVFELTPTATGEWTEKILHSFQANGTDGTLPQSGLVIDSQGNLYGTTVLGGNNNLGTVYELKPAAGGGWKEEILHSFRDSGDGQFPQASLIFDASGNLYGATSGDGQFANGTVFELTRTASGGWKDKVLHSFGTSNDGGFVLNSLFVDPAGNLYGTTQNGGSQGVGMVFELSPQGGGLWTTTILHNFTFGGTDGLSPLAGVIMDSAGNLYGTTQGGGPHNFGTVFELSPNPGGTWTERILHDFHGTDGFLPVAPLIFDDSGHLYGTTFLGGATEGGEVFEIIP